MYRYLIQTKPRIILLLTMTGIVAYFIPSLQQVSFVNISLFVFFGILAAGGGLTINNVIDRDLDEKMSRTKGRPTVGPEAIPAKNLVIFGVLISTIGIVGGWLWFGIYTAIQLAWGNLFYLLGYTLYLKRNSIWNTIIGGLASPAPVWAGFAARFEIQNVSPENAFLGIPIEGWLLGLFVFVWTPSHTWAMATKNFDDYKLIDIPMLPVVVGLEKTGLFTLISGVMTIIYSIWLGIMMYGDPIIAFWLIVPNLYLLYGLLVFYRNPSPETGRFCFVVHNIYLTVMFAIILIFFWQ